MDKIKLSSEIYILKRRILYTAINSRMLKNILYYHFTFKLKKENIEKIRSE